MSHSLSVGQKFGLLAYNLMRYTNTFIILTIIIIHLHLFKSLNRTIISQVLKKCTFNTAFKG